MSKKFSLEKEQEIIKLYQEGKTQKEIGKLFNTYNTSIRRVLLRYGVETRSTSEVIGIVKKDIFNNLNCLETNYWLGLLATDGCITKQCSVVLDLHKNDKYLLEQFIIFTKYPLKLYKTVHYTGVESYRVSFSNLECVKTLESYGITKRKSLNIELTIPLTFSLLRGIIDGDGSIGKYVTIASGSIKFVHQIVEFLNDNNYHPTIQTRTNNRKNPLYIISILRKEELFRLYYDLYSESYPCLLRKKDKFGSLLQKWSNEKWAKTVEQIQQYRASK